MLPGVASSAGRAAVHAIRVQIVPAPRSLADSRQVLRVLQSYGEITTYRWLKHDAHSSAPNSAMAIFADGEAMNKFLRDSPVTFEIQHGAQQEAESRTTLDKHAEPSEPEADSNEDAHADLQEYEPLQARSGFPEAEDTRGYESLQRKSGWTDAPNPQLFRIMGDVWQGKHKDWLERHQFWGNFMPNRTSIPAQDLAKRVPLVGLCDLDVKGRPELPIRVLKMHRERLDKKPTVRELVEKAQGRLPARKPLTNHSSADDAARHWV